MKTLSKILLPGLVTLLLLCCVSLGQDRSEGKSSRAVEGYNISFDQVEVRTFVKLIGDITGKKFVVGEGVDGKITIVAPRIKKDEAYPLFVSILESAGCSVVRDGEIYRVVALPARVTHTAPVVGPGEKIPLGGGIVTKIFRLNHVSASGLRKVLESKVGGGKTGGIGAIEDTNHLVVTDTAESIRRIEKIVSEIDKPGLRKTTEVVMLKHAGAEDLADQLNMAMAEGESRGQRLVSRLPRPPGVSLNTSSSAVARQAIVVASPHSNSLILVGTSSQVDEMKRILKKMDVDAPSGRGRLNAIFLKYISADDAAKSITALLAKMDKNVTQRGNSSRHRQIAVEAVAANNALIVDASLGDFEVVKNLVEQLDRVPDQVQIDVLIVEVSASDELSLGVEMAALEMPSKVGATTIQGASRLNEGADNIMNAVQSGLFPLGMSVGVAHGDSVGPDGKINTSFPGMININAMRKNGKVRIRSETSLGVQNNQEAEVVSVNDIPILESVIQGSGQDRDVIRNIKRMEVGVKLKLTPHIIPGGQVRMKLNPSIEAIIDKGSPGQFTPTIARRQVDTTVTVPDGKTIVIAGLTHDAETRQVKKVPILGSVPLLGWLFSWKVDSTEKSNVLILVTPHIVNMANADEDVKRWEKKTGLKVNEKK